MVVDGAADNKSTVTITLNAPDEGGHRFGIIRSKDGTTADMVEGLLATGMHGLHVDA